MRRMMFCSSQRLKIEVGCCWITMVFIPLLASLVQPTHFILILLPFLILLIFSDFHRRRGANSNLPPGPTPLPIIGNLHNLRGLPHLAFHRLSEKYGPIISLKLGQVPSIVVSSADMALEITKTQDSVFCSRSQLTALRRFSYGGLDIAFSPFDDHWKQTRRICNVEVLSVAKVQSFGPIRREEVNALVNSITKACSRKEGVNMSERMLTFTMNNLFRQAFGKRIIVDGEHESRPQVYDILKEMLRIMTEFGAGDLFPSMGWVDVLTGWRRKLAQSFQKMDSMFEGEIRERILLNSRGSVQEHCFVDFLLQPQATEEGSQSLTMSEIKAVLMNMFTAGGDTTSTTVEWGLTRLMKNPLAMKKAQEEVRRVVGGKGVLEESDLQHLHYLKMVINETLRLHPPVPFPPPRESMKDTKVGDYNIPAKMRVYVSLWSVGRDPKYWGVDAEDFRPERFENSVINFKGAHREFIPFGSGRRICPGISLAVAGVELVFANLLHAFDWALPDGMVNDDVDLEAKPGMIVSKKVPLVLVPSLPSPPITKG
ncbi:Cytochrome P450 71B36 [Platanthera zijinensis]|uniref:Cytochrome P450 71B36 n=1 Tax=Platanthera zijinensis TaxID=2320716 RepID=A0AAP0G6J6_9ASPA